MNEMQIFKNPEFGSIRLIEIDGEPWFVGADICKALEIGNVPMALSRLDADEKNTISLTDGIPGNPNKTIVNEPGLYSLVLGSRKPEAKAFKRWITHEVLPAIRRHGVYAVDEVLNNPDMLIAALTELKAERAKTKSLQQTVAVQNQQISEMQPKASYYDVVLNCKDLVSVSVIAKDYGWSAKRMNQYLNEKGVQYRQGDKIWLLYQKYAERGYTNTKTQVFPRSDGTLHTSVHTYWTQAGRLFIYDLLKADGILPTMEKPQGLPG